MKLDYFDLFKDEIIISDTAFIVTVMFSFAIGILVKWFMEVE